jgi:hypothetical protein
MDRAGGNLGAMPQTVHILLPLAQNIVCSWLRWLSSPRFIAGRHFAGRDAGRRRPAVRLCATAMVSPVQLSEACIDSRNIVIAVGTVMAGPVTGTVCADGGPVSLADGWRGRRAGVHRDN